MAGDWIKMRNNLWASFKVVRMALRLGVPRSQVIGALNGAWMMADEHSEDGVLEMENAAEVIDAFVEVQGFSAAMESVGWLQIDGNQVTFPRFDEHNSKTAKRRADDQKRKKTKRSDDMSALLRTSVRKTSASCGQNADQRREEKSREEKNRKQEEGEGSGEPPTPPPSREEFQSAWNEAAERHGWATMRAFTEKRATAFRTRCRDPDWCEHWREALAEAEQSPFCCGENDRGWTATPDFFLRPDTLTKLLEGAFRKVDSAKSAFDPMAIFGENA